MNKKEAIVIYDFGSQYTQLIAKSIRLAGVYSVIYPYDVEYQKVFEENEVKGIILSGGPRSVHGGDGVKINIEGLISKEIPILGICYGMQLIAYMLGGRTGSDSRSEYGYEKISIEVGSTPLLEGIPSSIDVWMSHGDCVEKVPSDFKEVGHSANNLSIMIHKSKKIYGLQFHPEVTHSEYGQKIIDNFLEITKISREWKMSFFIEESIRELQERVGDKKVVLGLSGGVDSMTLSYLLEKAIGKQLTCVFIDNGLLRKEEASEVRKMMEGREVNFLYVEARKKFLSALKSVEDPEEKRKIIGRLFVEVFHQKIGKIDFLSQGTLYPDVIESISIKGPSDKIKTHHNLVDEVLKLKKEGKLIEPFDRLFKDEVRLLGKELFMPNRLIERHPFPGPGLAIRILGEVTESRLEILREADAILMDEIRQFGYYNQLWQCFAVLLPIRSVGVVGDQRAYGFTIVLRCVSSENGMTADFEYLPKEVLVQISSRIIGEVDEVARVVLDITSKPPATIEWE